MSPLSASYIDLDLDIFGSLALQHNRSTSGPTAATVAFLAQRWDEIAELVASETRLCVEDPSVDFGPINDVIMVSSLTKSKFESLLAVESVLST